MEFSRQEYWSGVPLPSPSKEQASFNFMAAVTICTLEPKEIKSVTVCIVSPSICYEVMGLDGMI